MDFFQFLQIPISLLHLLCGDLCLGLGQSPLNLVHDRRQVLIPLALNNCILFARSQAFRVDSWVNICYYILEAIALCSHCGQVALSLEHSVGFFYVIDTELTATLNLLGHPLVHIVDTVNTL